VHENVVLFVLMIVVQRIISLVYIPCAHFWPKRWKCLSPDDMMEEEVL